jgi:hypothetical protein
VSFDIDQGQAVTFERGSARAGCKLFRCVFYITFAPNPPTVTMGLPQPLPTGFVYVQPTVQANPNVTDGTYWAPQAETSATSDQGAVSWCFTALQYVGSSGATPQSIKTCTLAVTDSGGEDGNIYFDASPPTWYQDPTTLIEANLNGLNGTSLTFDMPGAQIPVPCMGYNETGIPHMAGRFA